jgi:hypothetical protein
MSSNRQLIVRPATRILKLVDNGKTRIFKTDTRRLELRSAGSIVINNTINNNNGGFEHTQTTPSATWIIPHTLGRLPSVKIYIAGREVGADVEATLSSVTITFPSAISGKAVIT